MTTSIFSTETLGACREICGKSGSNFTPVFALLPKDQKEAMTVLYSFMRLTDDISDGESSQENRRTNLNNWKKQLSEILNDKTAGFQKISPVLNGVKQLVEQANVAPEWLYEVIAGVEEDLIFKGYTTKAERDSYCFKVASVVGLCCLAIWKGNLTKGRDAAIDTGYAFQRTNILRDLMEDFKRGRCYLPGVTLDEFGVSPMIPTNGTQKEAWNRLIRFEINEIEKLFLSGRTLLPLLPRPGRAVFSGFLGIYHAILIQIAKDPEVVWRKRVRVGSIRKSQIMLQALRIKWIGF